LKEHIDFNGIAITLEIKPHLKHLYIRIGLEGEVIVRTAMISKAKLFELLLKKEIWIRNHLVHLKSRPSLLLGKEIFFFGQIEPIDDEKFDDLRQMLLALRKKSDENIRQCYYRFYKAQAYVYLNERVMYFSKLMQVEPSKIKLRRMKRRWGSCSSQSEITFNILLMQLSKELVDYVVVHELAHLRHMNHSTSFHRFVAKVLKDEKQLRHALKVCRLPNV